MPLAAMAALAPATNDGISAIVPVISGCSLRIARRSEPCPPPKDVRSKQNRKCHAEPPGPGVRASQEIATVKSIIIPPSLLLSLRVAIHFLPDAVREFFDLSGLADDRDRQGIGARFVNLPLELGSQPEQSGFVRGNLLLLC